jgi:hypothetical protein
MLPSASFDTVVIENPPSACSVTVVCDSLPCPSAPPTASKFSPAEFTPTVLKVDSPVTLLVVSADVKPDPEPSAFNWLFAVIVTVISPELPENTSE